MHYIPQVDDYVRWEHAGHVDEGWVYFKCDECISIEVAVKDKPHCQYTIEEKHKKIHVLVVCANYQWKELEYVRNRRENNIDEYKSQQYRHKDP